MYRSVLSAAWMPIVRPAKNSNFCVETPSRRSSTAIPSTYGAMMLAPEASASASNPRPMRQRYRRTYGQSREPKTTVDAFDKSCGVSVKFR